MRRITIGLLGLLMIAAGANNVAAQQQEPKPPSTRNDTPREMTGVERAVEEARSRGEIVVLGSSCAGDCENLTAEERNILNGRAIRLPKPAYPPIARAAGAEGEVEVQVLINPEGGVIAASAVSGHPWLQASSVKAARGSVFAPTKLDGKPVMVVGILKYKFMAL